MLKINETKINNFLDKNIKLKKLYPIIKINSSLIDYINFYIDFMKVKKIIKYKTVNQIDFNILDHINKKYKSIEYIKSGEGLYGIVYKLNNNTCVKIEEIDIRLLYKNIIIKNNEIKISKICGNAKISPKIYFNEIIYNEYNSYFYYYTYMEFIDGITLYNFIEKVSINKINKEIKNKIFKLLVKKKNILHKLGYVHNDLHMGNIILKMKKDKIIDLFIIDYGLSKNLNNLYANGIKKYLYENNNENLIMYLIHKKYIEIDLKNTDKLIDIYKKIVDININNINNIKYKNAIYNSLFLNNIFKNICENKIKIIETNNIIEYLEKKYIIVDKINDVSEYYFFKGLSYDEDKYYEELYKIIEVIKDNEKYLIILYKVYNLGYQSDRLKYINCINIFSNKSIFYINNYEYIIDKDNIVLLLSIKIPNDFRIVDIKSYFEIEDKILNKKNFMNKINKIYKNMISSKYPLRFFYDYRFMFFTLKNNKINNIYYITHDITINNFLEKNTENIFSNNQNIYFTNKLIENKIVIIK